MDWQTDGLGRIQDNPINQISELLSNNWKLASGSTMALKRFSSSLMLFRKSATMFIAFALLKNRLSSPKIFRLDGDIFFQRGTKIMKKQIELND